MDCGECTLCCKLLNVYWMDAPPTILCRECVEGHGCRLWPNIPEGCKLYECSWNLTVGAHIDLRPDNCHVIWDSVNGHIMFGTQDPDYPVQEVTERQIANFVKTGQNVVLYTPGSKLPAQIACTAGYTPENIWKETMLASRMLLHDRTEL